ncbi:hypothetical protein [Wocania ichthyoenteri]|uniref:hypothetical protein n=1 Tax=Wocania ichthyoenteri TaxID=1230531 RepID=UPI00053ED483|nr:hypothetical protein [Wocania ichthyoenteri]
MKNNEIIKNEISNQSRFYTDNRFCVNQRIIDNKTIVFLNKKEADKYANKIKTYVYEIFIERKISKTHFSKIQLYGYAVPK